MSLIVWLFEGIKDKIITLVLYVESRRFPEDSTKRTLTKKIKKEE